MIQRFTQILFHTYKPWHFQMSILPFRIVWSTNVYWLNLPWILYYSQQSVLTSTVLSLLHFRQNTLLLVFAWMVSFTVCIHISAGSERFRAKRACIEICLTRVQSRMFLKCMRQLHQIKCIYIWSFNTITLNVCFFLKIFSQTVHGNSFFVFTELSISACTLRMCNRSDFLLLETRPQYLHVALAAKCLRIWSFKVSKCLNHFWQRSHWTRWSMFVCSTW